MAFWSTKIIEENFRKTKKMLVEILRRLKVLTIILHGLKNIKFYSVVIKFEVLNIYKNHLVINSNKSYSRVISVKRKLNIRLETMKRLIGNVKYMWTVGWKDNRLCRMVVTVDRHNRKWVDIFNLVIFLIACVFYGKTKHQVSYLNYNLK